MYEESQASSTSEGEAVGGADPHWRKRYLCVYGGTKKGKAMIKSATIR